MGCVPVLSGGAERVQIKPNLLSVPFLIASAGLLMAQGQAPALSQPSSGTITITLQDALERAQKYGAQVQAANFIAAAARATRVDGDPCQRRA